MSILWQRPGGEPAMIIRCSYCNRCLNEKEYQVLERKVRTSRKRRPTVIRQYHPEDSDIEELRTLKSGARQLWFRAHRAEIIEYLEKNGDEETRRHFGIKGFSVLANIQNYPSNNNWEYPTIELLKSKIATLESEIRTLRTQLPAAIASLPIEEQVKLYTFKLAEAVQQLKSQPRPELLLENLIKV